MREKKSGRDVTLWARRLSTLQLMVVFLEKNQTKTTKEAGKQPKNRNKWVDGGF